MLQVYNTLTGKKEAFCGQNGKAVRLFVCGPTVYESSHLGHARTYVVFDAIVKYLKEKWFDVFYLQNITDIDDKIIQQAEKKGVTSKKLAGTYEKAYLKNMKALKITSVTKYARATDYVKEIISQIKRLEEKGFAYEIQDGVYYDIKKFKNYGRLSRRTALGAEDAVSRIDESKGKKNKGDFCLWKLSKKGEPKWPSPWGWGRPGWHIEDTAITEKFFGPQYDVHGGAQDLIFPHHEAEIAQMEAISGKAPMVKCWLHSGFLVINGKKMSKSRNNFITIEEFLKTKSARVLRLLVLKCHYRSPLDYTENLVLQTERELERVDEFLARIKQVDHKTEKNRNLVLDAEKEFEKAMEDDFNTPRALAAFFNLITQANSMINEDRLTGADVKNVLNLLKKFDRVFNFVFWPKKKEKAPLEIMALIKQREKHRKSEEWQKADQIRQKIKTLGWLVEDTAKGPKLKKI